MHVVLMVDSLVGFRVVITPNVSDRGCQAKCLEGEFAEGFLLRYTDASPSERERIAEAVWHTGDYPLPDPNLLKCNLDDGLKKAVYQLDKRVSNGFCADDIRISKLEQRIAELEQAAAHRTRKAIEDALRRMTASNGSSVIP